MTFEQIKLEIAKRLGDDDITRTRAVAGRAFEQAVTELALSDETRMEEIPDIIVNEDNNEGLHRLHTINQITHIDYPSNMVKFLDIYIHPSHAYFFSGGNELTLKEISWDEANRSKLEPAFRPVGSECFWYRTPVRVFLMTSEDIESTSALWIIMSYIKNPDMTDWTEDVNLINDLGYSRNFIYKCMTRAIQTLSNNQNKPSGK